MPYRPLFLTTALAAFIVAALLPHTVAAGSMSKVIELKSKSEDARRIVGEILEKEVARLDRCGEKYMAAKPKGPFLVRLKIRLSPQEAQVSPVKASDAKHPGVACVGSALAGVSWPKPSGKVDVLAEILLGRMKGSATKGQDLDLDKSEGEARAEDQRRAEARDREREKESRRDSSSNSSGSSVQWRSAQVGYIANSVEGGLSKAELARGFDDFVLPKIGKAWRRARAFNAMVRLRIVIGVKGQVKTVEVLKSSDAADFEGEVVQAVKVAEWPASDKGVTIEWTFAFKR